MLTKDENKYKGNGKPNSIVEWHGTDTRELAHYNKDKEIDPRCRDTKYKFNNQGFRSEEFRANKECAIFFGCSYTVGEGVPEEYIWPTLVAKHLGVYCYNMGVSGGSNDTAFRLAQFWIPKLNPKYVFMLSPSDHRIELLSRYNPPYSLTPTGHGGHKRFYLDWIDEPLNCTLNRQKNILAIQHIYKDLIVVNSEELEFKDLGRDLMHPGIETHQHIAQLMIKQTENF